MNPNSSSSERPPYPQPLSNRGVGISMKPQAESFWIAKAPLWLIALSLFTIACCLVLLVMRTVVGNDATEASASTNEVQTVAKSRDHWKHGESQDSRRKDELLVSHGY